MATPSEPVPAKPVWSRLRNLIPPVALVSTVTLFGVVAVVAPLAVPFIFSGAPDPGFHAKYEKVSVGMTVAEVAGIFGPGRVIKPDEVPHYVAPKPGIKVPKDPPGAPPSTARNYPTELRPVLRGEKFLRWEHHSDYAIIGFKAGRVIDMYYWFPSL